MAIRVSGGLERLSIDEIYFGRHKKFYTLVIDLDTGQIVWVAKGKGGEALSPFWRALRASRAKIEAVAMDMSPAYWAAVMEHLPEAAIVFDRFHIMKLMNEKLDDLRRAMVNEATGPMKQTVKGIRYLLLMRRENVEEEKLPRLDEALKHNEPLFTAYLLKEALGLLWEQPTYGQMRSFLSEWCAWADESGIRQMRQMAKTLLQPQQRHPVLVETPDQQRPDGGHQQQDQDAPAPNLWPARRTLLGPQTPRSSCSRQELLG